MLFRLFYVSVKARTTFYQVQYWPYWARIWFFLMFFNQRSVPGIEPLTIRSDSQPTPYLFRMQWFTIVMWQHIRLLPKSHIRFLKKLWQSLKTHFFSVNSQYHQPRVNFENKKGLYKVIQIAYCDFLLNQSLKIPN